MAYKIGDALSTGNTQGYDDNIMIAEISDIESVVQLISQKNHVTILSGSGISVASGIKSFIG